MSPAAAQVTVVNRELARTLAEHPVSPRLRFPERWLFPGEALDAHSIGAEPRAAAEGALTWLGALGCSKRELDRAAALDVAGLVGMPFPQLTEQPCLGLAKFLTVWRLWADLTVEASNPGEVRWPFPPELFTQSRRPVHDLLLERSGDLGRLEQGMASLLGELTRARSSAWLARLCDELEQWTSAVAYEVEFDGAHRDVERFPSFGRQLELRISTSGAYVLNCLAEHAQGLEIPDFLYDHPTCRRMQYLSGRLVAIDHAVFALARDATDDRTNLVAALMTARGLGPDAAMLELAALHEATVAEFDRLAEEMESWADAEELGLEGWVRGVRQCCVGLARWTAQSPRFAAFALVVDNRMLSPRLELA